jgi:Tfp pilus assembly protein PilO
MRIINLQDVKILRNKKGSINMPWAIAFYRLKRKKGGGVRSIA